MTKNSLELKILKNRKIFKIKDEGLQLLIEEFPEWAQNQKS